MRRPSLVRRHREHDRLDACHLALVDVQPFELAAHSRDELHHALQRAHLLEHPRRGEEVVERELSLPEPPLHLLLLVLLDGLLRLLDERQHVPHAEDAGGHAIRVEDLQLVELLAHRGELHRAPGDRLDGERGAATCVAVQLRQHDAVEGDPLLEGARHRDRLLARHRVEDEEHVQRLHGVAHVGELVHQGLVDLEPAGGVDDHDVTAVGRRAFEPVARRDDRVRGVGAIDGDLELAPQLLELVDRGRPLEVGGDQAGLLLLVLAKVERELGRGRRLAGALEAAEENDGGRSAEREPRVRRSHQLGQLLVDDLDHLLARLEPLQHLLAERPLSHGFDELLHDLEVDVRLEQGEADLPRRAGDRLLVEA